MLLLLAGCRDQSFELVPEEGPERVAGDTPECISAPVVLNEVLASNTQGVEDEDGDQVDWIELTLLDGDAVDLAGWALSDGGGAWSLPATVIHPGDTPLFWASGKDRTDHADFSIDTSGETLTLLSPGDCVADSVETGRLYADESYGRADGAWEYFLEPTPGQSNTTESRPGFAETPTLSPGAGFYATEVEVEASAGEVRYTLDGSVPTDDSALFDAPIAIDGSPTVVRARAFEDGLWPSRIATATYFEEQLETNIRVISLAVDPPDLWDDDRGIYAYGPDYEANYPYFGANFWELWERDLHIEIWDADGALLVSQDAGIQIAGGYSRAFDQRNFELLARGGYSEETFASALFDEEEIDAFHRLYLRNGGDWCGTQIVDASVQSLFRDDAGGRLAAVDAQAYEPALVWLNGEFWGLYELKERLDEWWIEAHHGEDPEALDRVKLGWTHEANWELEQGDWEAFDEMEMLRTSQSMADPAAWAELEARVDLVNLASSVVAQGWIGNSDWWGNNLRLWRPRTDGGRWRWMVYDFGHGWPVVSTDHLGTSVSTSAKGLPIADALENETFRNLLILVHAEYLNTTLRGDVAAARVQALADEIAPVMSMQRDRWCGGPDVTAFESAVEYAVRFASARASVMDEHVLTHLAPAGHASLTLDADGEGSFGLTVVEVQAPFSGTFYAGVPVTVTALPADGWTFAGWSDGGTDATIELPMEGDTSVSATFVR